MKIGKKIALILTSCAFATSVSAFSIHAFATAKPKTICGIFDVYGFNVTENYGGESGEMCGELLSSSKGGAYIRTKNAIAGTFECDFDTLSDVSGKNSAVYKFTFSDAENAKNEFSVVYEASKGVQNIYVEKDGEKFGISYGANYNLLKQTAANNASGVYMKTSVAEGSKISFNPSLKQVKINGRTLWDFTKENNDGKNVGFYLEGFLKYNVTFELESVNYGKADFLMYSMLGRQLSDEIAPADVAPKLAAEVTDNMVAGKPYTIAKPVAFDLEDGAIASESVCVELSKNGELLYSETYADGLCFTVDKAGEYDLAYKVTDSKGNESSEYFALTAFSEMPAVEYVCSDGIDGGTVGVGTKILLPSCRAYDELFRYDASKIPLIAVYQGSEKVYETSAGQDEYFTFDEAGEYRVVYGIAGNRNELIADYLVLADKATISYVKYEDSYDYGDVVNIQDATITLGGEQKAADCVVICPDNSYRYSKHLRLDGVGLYRVEYSAVFNGKKEVFSYRFIAGYSAQGILKSGVGFSAKLTSHPNDETMKGLLIESKAKQDVTFALPIDFEKAQSDENFIELISVAREIGAYEYNRFYITLTDTKNPDNFIRIQIYGGPSTTNSYVSVALGNSPYCSYDASDVSVTEGADSGKSIIHSFTNVAANLSDNVIKLRLDYKNKRILAYAENGKYETIADFNQLSFIKKYGTEWAGFTDGKAYVSVKYDFRSRGELAWDDKAFFINDCKYLVTKFGGYSLQSGSIIDGVAPMISVKTTEEISDAEVNRSYRVFEASATDNTSENVKVIKQVYYNYGTNEELLVPIENNTFTPKVTGTYTIVYTATDLYGNVAVRTVEIEAVKAVESLTAAVTERENEPFTGKKVYLKDVIPAGGVGNYEIERVVELVGDGSKAELFSDENGYYFIPKKAGEYKVSLSVEDYIQSKYENNYTLSIGKNDKPIFDENIVLPVVFTAGRENVLPTVSGVDYSLYPNVRKQAEIYVKYPNGTYEKLAGNEFVADAKRIKKGESLTVKYELSGENGTNTLEREIPVAVFSDKDGQIDIRDYFVSDNMNIESNNGSIFSSVASGNGSFVFGKKLLASAFTVTLDVVGKNFDCLVYTLIDSANPAIRINVRVYCTPDGKYQYALDGSEMRYTADAIRDTLILNYDQASGMVYFSNGTTHNAYVTQTEYGEAFEGFTSNYVFLQVGFEQATDAKIEIVNILNQNIIDEVYDNGEPIVITESSYGGNAVLGEEHTIPKAYSCDVLSYAGEVTVTVKYPDGKPVVAKDGTTLMNAPANKAYKIALNMLGKYTIKYNCSDENGNSNRGYNVNLTVAKAFEDKEIVLSYNGSLPEEVSAGDTITLPTAEVKGADGIQIVTTVFSPDYVNKTTAIKDNKITLSERGRYIIRYIAFDEVGNSTVETFYVNVK